MAKKRINMPFIVISLLVLAMLAGGAYTLYKLRQKDPNRVVKIADDLFNQGRLEEAANHYAGAATLKKDPTLFVKGADILYTLTYQDGQNLGKAEQFYASAIQTDPNCIPAYDKLIEIMRDRISFNTRSGASSQQRHSIQSAYDRLDEYAKAILRAQPDNEKAKRLLVMNQIDRWLSGVELDPDKVQQATDELDKLQAANPKDVEIISQQARVKIQRATALLARADKTEMRQLISQAFQIFIDATAADPENASLPYMHAMVALQVAQFDSTDKEIGKTYIDRARAQVEAARKLAKPDNTNYVDIIFIASEFLKDSGDRKGAEDLLREAIKLKPNELALRIPLAKLLAGPGGRIDEAVDLLQTVPPPDPATLAGLKGALYRTTEAGAKIQLANTLIDKGSNAQDAETRDAAFKQAVTIIDEISARYGESAALLRARGKMELIKGDAASALTTFSKAWEKTDKSVDRQGSLETANLLARANILAGQTSKAKEWLTLVLKSAPDYTEGRILLAQTLLRENNITEAKAEVELLRKAMPDRPDIVELYMRTLDPVKDAEELKSTYAKLPENTRAAVFAKVGVASAFNFTTEQQRLLELAVAKEPRDVQAWLYLSGYWETAKNKDKAIEVITQAQKTSPEDPRLSVRLKQLKGDTDVEDYVSGEIAKISDAPKRYEAYYNYWTSKNEDAKALEALQNWEKAAPDSLEVAERAFNYYINKGKVDLAEPYAQKLIAANADKAGGKLYRWNLAMAKGDLEKALELANDLTRERPEFAQSWLSLGQTLQAQGAKLGDTAEAKTKYEAAIPKFNEALSRQGTNIQAYLGIIQCSQQLKLYSDVKLFLKQAIERTKNPMFTQMLNDHEVRHGDPEQVIADRESTLKANPNDPKAYVALAEVYRATASVRNEKGDEKGALEYIGKAMDVMSQAVDKYPDNIRFLMGYSEMALMFQKGEEAEKRWKTFAEGPGKQNPSETAIAMSGFYRRAGKIADAEKVLRDAMEQQKDKPEVFTQLALASVLSDQDKLDEALAVLTVNADRPEIMRTRIDLLLRQDKREEAAALIDQAIAASKGPSLDLHTMRGAILFAKGDDEGGMKAINSVLQQDPNQIAALIQRGRRNAMVGRTNDAITDLQKARDLISDPQNNVTIEQAVQVRLLLSEAYRLAGQPDRSLNELEGALAINKTNKALRLQLLQFYLNPASPRFTEAERLVREAREIPVLANDPDMLTAEATMWTQRKDYQRARAAIVEALKRDPKNQGRLASLFKIMLDGRQYQQLIQVIDQQPDEIKTSWWAMRDRALAVFNMGDKKNGLAALDTLVQKVGTEKNYAAVRSIVTAAVEADSGNMETGIKLLGDRINTDPMLKVQAIQLYLDKPDLNNARNLVTELLAQGDKLPPEAMESALQQAAMAWSSDPGRDESKAQDAYLKLSKIRPDDYVIWNNLASLESLPPEKALEYSQKAKDILAKLNRVEPYVMDTYGSALLRSGRVDEAIAVLTDAYNSLKFRDVCLHLAEAYIQQKQWDAAAARLEEAQSLYNRDVADKTVNDAGAFQEKISAAQRVISANR